ncbi:MAG: Ppx/GppA family phosphatase [Gammaproteobacteria bacterium]|nr:Ppx/GppA family phosphatase [Gammaproteobacteria bacterium]
MIVGELRHGQLVIIDRLKETVRLSEGLEETGELTAAARHRALECLSRFGERLRHMHASNVRAAGTSTFRRARNSHLFCKEAGQALGQSLEIISGLEEARLIFAGVTHSTPPHDGARLVLDIGGGSTELILGKSLEPRALESLHMGCVVMTERYFRNGKISRGAFDDARLAVRLKLRPVKAFFRDTPGIEAIGTSGTIRATERVARELGLVDADLTRSAVEELIERVCQFDAIESVSLPGLAERRAQVWPGGLAILVELLAVLRIDRLKTSDGALREGLLYESLGRLQHEDARERSVQALAPRYNVDHEQAQRVAETADGLLRQCAADWGLTSPLTPRILNWSARLHEIGLDISHDGFQRHGAYIAANADLPGFPRAEQQFLAFLIASQRRHIDEGSLKRLPAKWHNDALRLSIILRLAVLLNRSRSQSSLPGILLDASEDGLTLNFPSGWLQCNPLTRADLDREKNYLADAGYALSVRAPAKTSD